MTNSRIILQQFSQETEAWLRLLEFLRIENVHLKTRIAEIASHDMSRKMLDEAEDFQHHFTRNDEMIALLKSEVLYFRRDISNALPGETDIKEIHQRQKKLRAEIETLQQKFNQLRFNFNHSVNENL